MARAFHRDGQRHGSGFSLAELLVALALSGLVSAAVMQLLVGDLRQVGQLGRWLHERQAGQRALELVRGELQRARAVTLSPGVVPLPNGCSLAGRRFVLQLQGRTRTGIDAAVLYSTGSAPSSIWRGAVLMRCGPAYGLDGEWSDGAPLSRVLIDALPPSGGFGVSGASPGLLKLDLQRLLRGGRNIQQQMQALVGSLPL